MTEQQTLSIPSLLLLAALSALAVRYFFFTPASPSSPRRSSTRTPTHADIEHVSQMFPQIPRRRIMWDLQRNGGSVAATTERILSRGTLDEPPRTFQPGFPIFINERPSRSRDSHTQPPPQQIDLIKRYNLTSKLSSPSSTPVHETSGMAAQEAWSNNKKERQVLLQRRREEMVLQARRKMEEKEKAKAAGR